MTVAGRQIDLTAALSTVAAIQIAGVLYYAFFFRWHGYLPAPFVYDKSDTFMDFFHVMYWSDHPGRYTDWGSIYPPINFLIMRFFSFVFVGQTHFDDGFAIRDFSLPLKLFIVALYLVVPAVTMLSRLWQPYSNTQKVLFCIFYALSAPVLFGMERGNLIVLCSLFAVVALSDNSWKRIVAVAILINIKPYFALLLLAPILSGKWSDALTTVLLAGSLFLATGLLLDPNFLYFLGNLLNFSQNDAVFSGREVLALPSSIAAFAYALAIFARDGAVRVALFDPISLSSLIAAANYIVAGFAVFALATGARRLSQTQMLAILMVATSNLGVWVGGYSLLIYPLLLPIFLTFRFGWLYVCLILAILLPLDLVTLQTEIMAERLAYLSQTVVPIEYQLGLGSLLRPLLNVALLTAVSTEVLAGIELPKGLGGQRKPTGET